MASRNVFFLALAALCVASSGRCEEQPVVVISSSSLQLNHRSGIAVAAEDLAAQLSNNEAAHVFCTVQINDLQLSDFSLYGDAYEAESSGGLFANIKSLMAAAKSFGVVSSVDAGQGMSIADALEAHLTQTHFPLNVQRASVRSAEDLASLEHAQSETSLWSVQLPGNSEPLDRSNYLKRSDHLVGALREKLGTSYTLLLTSNSEALAAAERTRASARHLLSAQSFSVPAESDQEAIQLYAFFCPALSPNVTNPASVILSFKEVSLAFNATNNTQVVVKMSTDGVPQENLIGCGEVVNGTAPIPTMLTARVDMEYLQNVSNVTVDFSAQVSFQFYRTNGKLTGSGEKSSNSSFYWELRFVTVEYNLSVSDINGLQTNESVADMPICYTPPSENDWVIAPRNFSFSCQPQRDWVGLVRKDNWRTQQNPLYSNGTVLDCVNTSWVMVPKLSMRGLQVQAFDISVHEKDAVYFGAAVDCVGYFSGQTWMGLLVGVFLIVVLFMASLIFLAMETPDRFDDPKGKNIQIEK